MALHRRFRTALVFPLAICLGTAAMAEQHFGCEAPLKLAFFKDQLFYHDGRGIDADLVAELSRRSGCRFVVSLRNRAEIWTAIAAGDLDMATSGIATQERRALAFFVPYLYLRNKLIVRRSLDVEPSSLEEFLRLPGARIGVVAGYQYGPYAESLLHMLRGEGRVRVYVDEADVFAALAGGKVEGVIGHEQNLIGSIRDQSRLSQLRVVDSAPMPAIAHGLVLSRRHFTAAQSAEWQRLMDGLRLDGGLAKIMQGNASPDSAAEFLDSGYRYESDEGQVR